MSEQRTDLTEVIRSVTDLWDEPLDEVHDIPEIVNAILASGLIGGACPCGCSRETPRRTDLTTPEEQR